MAEAMSLSDRMDSGTTLALTAFLTRRRTMRLGAAGVVPTEASALEVVVAGASLIGKRRVPFSSHRFFKDFVRKISNKI